MRANNKWSILLYVLFLSSFLILFFASFQHEIEGVVTRAEDSSNSAIERSRIEDALATLKNKPVSSLEVEGNADLSFVSLDYDGTVFSGVLSLNETREYWITSTGGTAGLSLSTSAPVLYRLAAFQSGSESTATIFSSGLATASVSIPFSGSANRHVLTIESLSGYARYNVSHSGATVIPSSSMYMLERTIRGYKNKEGIYEVLNFTPKSYPNIAYGSLGMYLKN